MRRCTVIWVMIIGFFVLMLVGVPIAFAMGASALFYILIEGISLEIVTQRFFTSTQSFAFLAIPFFILMGSIMEDRKSTRLNSSHVAISYAVFCLKKKKKSTK